jgi:Ran GTPase-activating protein (RanGAP) involved in mRNA processing and transport
MLQQATDLDLSQSQVSVMDAIALGTFFQVQRVLESLNLSQNYICGVVTEEFEDMSCVKNGKQWHGLQGRHTADGLYYLCCALATVPLTSLDLSRCHLRKEGARHVAEALLKSSRSLTNLNLASNELEAEGVEHISTALDGLRQLNLEDNHIHDEGSTHLAAALAENTTLEALNIAGNVIGVLGARELSVAFNVPTLRVRKLAFGNCTQVCMVAEMFQARFQNKGIGSSEGIIIAAFLHRCPSIIDMDLSRNELGNSVDSFGLEALTNAMAENTSLWALDLRRNALSTSAKDRLRGVFTSRANLKPVPPQARRQPGVHPPPMPRLQC